MKVFILGAGGQGGPCAKILAGDPAVEKIVLADIDNDMLKKVEVRVNSDKMQIRKVDARNIDEIVAAARGCSVIIDLSMPWLATNTIEAAIKLGIHYVNTAFDQPFWDQLVNNEPLFLNARLKEKGLTALLGCGMAPGFLNILTRYYTDKLDTVESIKLRLGKKMLSDNPYNDIIAPWNPGWSPTQALIDCAEKPYVYRAGRYEQLEPYSEIEEWRFPDPLGTLLVSHHSHEEVYTLPKNINKGLGYCDFKYYVSYQPAALVSMGLASKEEVDVKGMKIRPIDLVSALLPRPGNAFLEETDELLKEKDKVFFMSTMIQLKGLKDGNIKEYLIHCPNLNAPGPELLQLFGTSFVSVALPAITGAKMAVEGLQTGIVFPEELNAEDFLCRFKATGISYQWVEL